MKRLLVLFCAAGLLAACSSSHATVAGTSSTTAPSQSSGSTATSPTPSSPTDTYTPSGTVNSCNIISVAEAGAALGEPVSKPRLGKAYVEGGRACVFYGPEANTSASPDSPVFDTVRVVLVTGPDATKYYNDYHTNMQAVVKDISGLGDSAFFEGASVSVLKGQSYLRVAVIAMVDVRSAEEQLAQLALPRM